MKWPLFKLDLTTPFNQAKRIADIGLLWPACLDASDGNADVARAAFMVHAMNDGAWSDLSDAEIYNIVDKLEVPSAR